MTDKSADDHDTNDDNIDNAAADGGSHGETGDEIDIRKMCDCVAGGICRVDTRTATTLHRVHLWWSESDDRRAPDTVASPTQLDAWITHGVITGAWCPTCEDVVIHCPSFAAFLTAQRWDTASDH